MKDKKEYYQNLRTKRKEAKELSLKWGSPIPEGISPAGYVFCKVQMEQLQKLDTKEKKDNYVKEFQKYHKLTDEEMMNKTKTNPLNIISQLKQSIDDFLYS